MRFDALRTLPTKAPVLLVLGEPGIGKTTFLREAATRHTGAVHRVGCQRIARKMQLDPLHALLRTLARQYGAEASAPSESETLVALRQALEKATMVTHPLVQLDDVQWADEASLNAIPYLVERLVDFPITWHVAARTGYEATVEMQQRFRRSGLAESVTLEPLADSEILAIVDEFKGGLDDERRRSIVGEAAGNPLYAQLLAGTPRAQKPNIAILARDHVSDLSTDALFVAAALGVSERTLDELAIGALAEMAPAAVRAALEQLRERSITEPREGGIAIRHDLLSEAILAACSPDAVAKLHLNVAAIETGEKRARHLLAANTLPEARSVFVDLAWTAFEKEQWDYASRCFTEALAIDVPGSSTNPLEDRTSLRAAAALSRRVTGYDPRGPMSDEEAGSWSGLPASVRARLELANMLGFFIARAPGEQTRHRFIALIDRVTEPAIAAEMTYLVLRLSRHYAEHDAARGWLERLRSLIPQLEETGAKSRARGRSALYAAVYGDWETGFREFESVVRSDAAAGDVDSVFRVVEHALGIMLEVGRIEDGLRVGRFTVELAGGSPLQRAGLMRNYATLLSACGRMREAFSVLSSVASVNAMLSPRLREANYAMQISIASQLGLTEHVRALVAEAKAIGSVGPLLQMAIASFEEQHGDLEEARVAFEADFSSPLRANANNLRFALLALSRIALATRDEKLMTRTLERLRKLEGIGPTHEAHLEWSEAYGLLLQGNASAALPLLRRAKSAPIGNVDVAHVQYEIARVTRSKEDLLESIERFRAIGADYMAERVVALAQNSRVPLQLERNMRVGSGCLTGRERTIALLVSSGKTNAEIALALSISKRTADHHVDHIRNKLGVRSRVEIAMAVASGAALQG